MSPACGQCVCGENLCETCAAFHTSYANVWFGDSLTGSPVESPRNVPEVVVSSTGGSSDIIEVSSDTNDLFQTLCTEWKISFVSDETSMISLEPPVLDTTTSGTLRGLSTGDPVSESPNDMLP